MTRDGPDGPQIGIEGHAYFLGHFPEEEQAARAADMAIRQYRPSDPTNFEGEESKTVADIRRWARRIKADERLGQVRHTSAFRGVSWVSKKDKWVAEIRVDGESTYLGGFNDEIEAAKAYDKAALRLRDTANTNFPPSDYDATEGEELP